MNNWGPMDYESESIFDSITDDALSGYRLHRLEVFNWGTFDKRVWSLKLGGRNSLVTGDIGSGKTTLVDAVTTLLVPPHRIAYNKAAGAQTRERMLRSYVLGYYKTERGDTGAARPVPLRDRNSYTVIVGVFRNEDYQQTVSLAEVFWITETRNQPERFFAAAERNLTISRDFAGFGTDISQLRKRLRTAGVDIFASFPPYGAWFRRRFGIEDEQAMDLFHQTVSMKSVGNLTDFVRDHMLEPFDAETRIKVLIDHFDDLNRAHEAVLIAKRQVELLAPLVADCNAYEELSSEVERLRHCREALRAYFASLKLGLLDTRLAELDKRWQRQNSRVDRLTARRDDERRQVEDIRQAIAANGGDRIERLAEDIRRLEPERDRCADKAERYRNLIRSVDESPAATEAEFVSQRERLAQLEVKLTERSDRLRDQFVEDTVEVRRGRDELAELDREIESLKARRSNIPAQQVSLREVLCTALSIDESELPFAGELLQVRDDERDWEGAAERVLRNFGLALLVADEHYAPVAAYVDRTHLKGRLLYFRVRQREADDYPSLHPDSLVRKLSVKPDSEFYAWLERELARRFDLACCATTELFRRERNAVTRAGQIKMSGERHEKDDRHRIDDRSRYVLGWTNEAKISALQADAQRFRKRLGALAERIDQTNRERSAVERQVRNLAMLSSEYTEFNEQDWKSRAAKIEQLREERDRLVAASDVLKHLQGQLDGARNALGTTETELDNAKATRSKTEGQQDQAKRLRTETETLIRDTAETFEQFSDSLDAMRVEALGEHRLTVDSCDNRQQDVRQWLQGRIDQEGNRLTRLSEKIVRAMSAYKEEFKLATAEMDAGIEAGFEYRAMLEKLKADDLPRFEARFKELLNENTIREVANFQSQMAREREEIRDRIERINRSLAEIDYNRGRYIVLETQPAPDADVRDFRSELRACTEGALTGSDDAEYSEAKFVEVKRIIDRLRGREGLAEQDRRWTAKVTDVRNWFVFSASERWREDNTEFEHYSDSGGKSGGQKEKLAYTVLAASLAYRFGLERGRVRSRSFRFVAIDEAFGRGSDESTQYALRLFEELHLQLLIVTPLQKIHVIEPFVAGVGFVQNEDGRASKLRNLNIEEYREEREKFSRVARSSPLAHPERDSAA